MGFQGRTPVSPIGEIMKTDARLTGAIMTPRRLRIGEIMKADAKLRSVTGGIMVGEIMRTDAKLRSLTVESWHPRG